MKVLILCTGNSCRSQMAHGFLQSFDKNIEVHSAGTEPAKQVNQTAVKVMSEVGTDIRFEDPSHASGTDEYIWSEFRRVRDEIKEGFYKFYTDNLKKQ